MQASLHQKFLHLMNLVTYRRFPSSPDFSPPLDGFCRLLWWWLWDIDSGRSTSLSFKCKISHSFWFDHNHNSTNSLIQLILVNSY